MRSLIAQNRISVVIDELLAVASAKNSQYKNELILLKSDFILLEKDKRLGIIDNETLQRRSRKITISLLELIDMIESEMNNIILTEQINKKPQKEPLITADNDIKKEISTTIKIFISYAHVDEAIRKLFEEKYLKAIQNNYEGNLQVWSDIKLKPAVSWDNKIKQEIKEAHVVLFFLSSAFLASDYIKHTEIKAALARYDQKQQLLVPVYIEEIPKTLLPFSDKQYLPGGRPLKQWHPQHKGWVKIQEGLISIFDDIKKGNIEEYFY